MENDLEGAWILEEIIIEDSTLSADEEGILSTLMFYTNGDGMLCGDYFYQEARNPERSRMMLGMPVYEFAPEAENPSFSAWMDCSEYPSVFEGTQGEEYNLRFDDQGELHLQFVSYTGGDYGIYSVNYIYVRPENKQSLSADAVELTAGYIKEEQFEEYGTDGTATIAEMDPVDEMGTPIIVQTNTTVDSMKVS